MRRTCFVFGHEWQERAVRSIGFVALYYEVVLDGLAGGLHIRFQT
jgi:hypothetical protein